MLIASNVNNYEVLELGANDPTYVTHNLVYTYSHSVMKKSARHEHKENAKSQKQLVNNNPIANILQCTEGTDTTKCNHPCTLL